MAKAKRGRFGRAALLLGALLPQGCASLSHTEVQPPPAAVAAEDSRSEPTQPEGRAARGADNDNGPLLLPASVVADSPADPPSGVQPVSAVAAAPAAPAPVTPAPAAPTPVTPAPASPTPVARGPYVVASSRPAGSPVAPAAGQGPAVPAPVCVDPHQRNVPTASGCLLNLAPNESPAERAVELSARLEASEAEKKLLVEKVQQLTAALEGREKTLEQSTREIQDAAEDVARTRALLQKWRQEQEEARDRQRKQDREDTEKLKAVIALLEKLLEANSPGEGKRPEPSKP